MNPASSAFATAYIACGLLAALGVLMRLTERLPGDRRVLSVMFVVPLVLVYLAGMDRIAGVDYDTYLAAYTDQGQAIPDPGYSALTAAMWAAGIDFGTFLLLQGVFTVVALWIASQKKGADPLVVVVVYLLHLAIVRDLSQSRIALAVAIYLLGQTRQRAGPKIALYVIAMSMHITVAVLIFLWAYAGFASRQRLRHQVLVLYLPLLLFAAFGGRLLDYASAIDPRVAFYLAWDEDAYGAPLASFSALGRTIPVVAAFCFAAVRFRDARLREYIVMELAGAAILIGFAEYSIFAARLSNVAISMYPIGLGVVAQAYRAHAQPRPRRAGAHSLGIRAMVVVTLAVLLARPGSFDALREVVPAAFVWASG